MNKQKDLALIQVLRGIASLLVVLYHVSFNFQDIFQRNFIFNFFQFGFSGVDIFFVLSGFIITYTSYNNISFPQKLFPFVKRRVVRIYPIYWIIISLFLLSQFLLPSFYKTPYQFNFWNAVSTYFLWPYHNMVNGVSWTLSYELFFYFLFSFAFIIRSRKLILILMTIYTLLIICIYSFGFNYTAANKTVSFLFYPMNIEFFMGVIAAIMVFKLRSLNAFFLIIAGIALFAIVIIISNSGIHVLQGVFQRVILFGIPSFLLITGVAGLELTKTIKVPEPLLSLGDASYSLYLLHLPLVVAGLRILSKFSFENIALLTIGTLCLIIFICCFSVLFYKYVEKPLIERLKARWYEKLKPLTIIK